MAACPVRWRLYCAQSQAPNCSPRRAHEQQGQRPDERSGRRWETNEKEDSSADRREGPTGARARAEARRRVEGGWCERRDDSRQGRDGEKCYESRTAPWRWIRGNRLPGAVKLKIYARRRLRRLTLRYTAHRAPACNLFKDPDRARFSRRPPDTRGVPARTLSDRCLATDRFSTDYSWRSMRQCLNRK